MKINDTVDRGIINGNYAGIDRGSQVGVTLGLNKGVVLTLAVPYANLKIVRARPCRRVVLINITLEDDVRVVQM